MAKATPQSTATPETALEKKGPTEMVAYDFGEDASSAAKPAAGYEAQTAEDGSIPFLYLLQSNSPGVAEEINGAKAGMFRNTVTGQLYPGKEQGPEIIPAYTRHEYTAWKPNMGGFQGRYDIEHPVVLAAKAKAVEKKLPFGELYDAEGNELTETFAVFAVIGADLSMVVIPFSSTKIKVYKNWMTRNRTLLVPGPVVGDKPTRVNPPLFANVARLGSVFTKSDKGDYFALTVRAAIEDDLMRSLIAPSDPRYLAAKSLKKLAESGEAKVNYEKAAEERQAQQKSAEGRAAF